MNRFFLSNNVEANMFIEKVYIVEKRCVCANERLRRFDVFI